MAPTTTPPPQMFNELQAYVLAEKEQRRSQAAQHKAAEHRHRLMHAAYARAPLEGETAVTFPVRSASCSSCRHECRGLLADRSSAMAAIVLHPWGPLGGSKHDPTVLHLCDLLGRCNLTTLRFDFRCGLGSGHASAADVRAAWAVLRALDSPPDRLLLLGYSYGALVAADAAPSLAAHLSALALVSPPLGAAAPLFLGRSGAVVRRAQALSPSVPLLLVCGADDQFCSERRFVDFAQGCGESSTTWHVARGAGSAHCADGACGHHHRRPVHHFNIYEYLEPRVAPWLLSTFGAHGSSLAELGRSDGIPRAGAQAGASGASIAWSIAAGRQPQEGEVV